MEVPDRLLEDAAALLEACRRRGLTLATAESCTGGLLAACLTEIAGSSEVLDRGFVTYSNRAKTDLLAVPEALLSRHGAVSAQVAAAMAAGALQRSAADLAAAVTGIAGPGGASPGKPVGLVYIAVQRRGAAAELERHQFPGDRRAVRLAATETALALLRGLAG